MKKFVVKRVLLSIVILFFVSMIIYAIMRCMPSSFVEQQALTLSQRPGAKSYDEWVAQLNASYGLDTGVIQGYFRWAAKAIRGQFGDSWYFNQPVLTKFASVIWYLLFWRSSSQFRQVLPLRESSILQPIIQSPLLHWSVFLFRAFSLQHF